MTVVVVGSLNLDRALTVGRLPAPGETVHATGYRQSAGGKGANQAVAAARLGATVHLVGAVGCDPEANVVLEQVRRAGVVTDGVVHLPHAATGQATVVVDEAGENLIVVQPGANGALDPTAVVIEQATVMLLSFEVGDRVLLAAATRGRALGATVVVNPSPWRPMPAGLLDDVDILIVNEHELVGLIDDVIVTDTELAAAAQKLGCDIVVTRGGRGAVLSALGRRPVEQPGVEVRVVDTTGCGDAFAGAFAASLSEGSRPEDALRLAVRAGSYAAMSHGTQASYASRDELSNWAERVG